MAKLTGQVVTVTGSGDLVTDIKIVELEAVPRDDHVRICCQGHTTVGIYPTEHGQPEMTFVAYEGAGGCLELSLIGDHASRFLGIHSGSEVTVEW